MRGFLTSPVGAVLVETVEEGVIRCGMHHVEAAGHVDTDSPAARRHLEPNGQNPDRHHPALPSGDRRRRPLMSMCSTTCP
jgi:hypothetical protein